MSRTISLCFSFLAASTALGCAHDAPDTSNEDLALGEAAAELSGGARWIELMGNGFDSLALPLSAVDGLGNTLLAGDFTGTHVLGGTTVESASGAGGAVVKVDRWGTVRWARTSTGTGEVAVTAVTADLFGNVYVVGVFDGTVDWGGATLTSAGEDDFFVVKLGKNGAVKWAKRFGGEGKDWASAVAVDFYGGLAVGFSTTGEIDLGAGVVSCASCDGAALRRGGVVVLDVAGNYIFDRGFESDEEVSAPAVAFGYAGDLWAATELFGAGVIEGTPVQSAGVSDIVLAHYDFYGAPLSVHSAGSVGMDFVTAVAARPDGGAVVTGALSETADLGGGELVVTGPFPDIFVWAVDGSGAHDWSFAFGSPSGEVPGGVAVDLYGNVAIAGALGGVVDLGDGPIGPTGFFPSAFVAKYDEDGELLWTEAAVAVPSPNPFAFDLSVLGEVAFDLWTGDLVVAGTFNGAFSFAGVEGSTSGPFGATNTVAARFRP